MSEQELNSYRLTSMEEPTDEMLSAIMKKAAEDVRKRGEEAKNAFSTTQLRKVGKYRYIH